jgi:hypothetical protein
MTHTPVVVGIDVSNAPLDLVLRPEGQFSAPHDEAGCAPVLERLRAVSPTLGVWEAPSGVELPLPGMVAAAGCRSAWSSPGKCGMLRRQRGSGLTRLRGTPRRGRTSPSSYDRSGGPCRMSSPRPWQPSWRAAGHASRR